MNIALLSLAQEAERQRLTYEKGFDLTQQLLDEWFRNQPKKK